MKYNTNIVTERIFRNSILSILDQVLTLGMSFILSIVLARFLGAESLGRYYLGLSLVGVVSIFSNFGISTILSREVAKNHLKIKRYLGNALSIKFFISLPLMLLVLLLICNFFNYNEQTVTVIMLVALYNGLLSSFQLLSTSFISLHRNDILLKVNVTNKVLTLSSSLLLLLLGFGLETLLYNFIFFSLILFIASFYALNRLIKVNFRFDPKFCKVYVLTSFPLVFASAAEFINLKIDTVFISNILGETSAGFYSASFSLFIGITLVPLALTKVYFPNFVSLYAKNKKYEAFKLFYIYFVLFFVSCLIVGTILYIYSHFLVEFIYGVDFFESGNVMALLGIALPFMVLGRLCKYTLLGLKENKFFFKATLSGTVCNLILNFYFVPEFGIVGAAYATIATEAVVMVATLTKLIGFSYDSIK